MAKTKNGKTIGRPRKVVDADMVERLAGIGCTSQEIASACECSKATIERRFASVLEKGRDDLKESLRRMQYKSANGGNVTMQIWLGKQYLAQSDKRETDHTSGGQPIKVIMGVTMDEV